MARKKTMEENAYDRRIERFYRSLIANNHATDYDLKMWRLYQEKNARLGGSIKVEQA